MPDPDSTIWYPVKCRHPALSGIRVKFTGYLPDSTVNILLQRSNGKRLKKGLKWLKKDEQVFSREIINK